MEPAKDPPSWCWRLQVHPEMARETGICHDGSLHESHRDRGNKRGRHNQLIRASAPVVDGLQTRQFKTSHLCMRQYCRVTAHPNDTLLVLVQELRTQVEPLGQAMIHFWAPWRRQLRLNPFGCFAFWSTLWSPPGLGDCHPEAHQEQIGLQYKIKATQLHLFCLFSLQVGAQYTLPMIADGAHCL